MQSQITWMTPPPTSELFKKWSARPKSLAAQSMTIASSSVHAGLQAHFRSSIPRQRDAELQPWITHVEARVCSACRVQIAEHTFEGTCRREISIEVRVLPVRESYGRNQVHESSDGTMNIPGTINFW